MRAPSDIQFKALAGLVAFGFAVLSPVVALAQAVVLEVDQSRPLRFNMPVSGVVVGNAGIADVIVHDPKTIFVIGKSVGETHVLAVDTRGKTVFSGTVQVRTNEMAGMMTIQRGKAISTNVCQERCIAVPSAESTAQGNTEAITAARARTAFAAGGGGSN
jgi:Flp pilus assembly secretin CpaC